MAPGRSRRALVLLALAVPSHQQQEGEGATTNPHTGLPLAPFTGEPFAQHGMQTSPNGIPPAAAWRDLGEGMKKHCFGFCGGGAGQGRGPCGDNGTWPEPRKTRAQAIQMRNGQCQDVWVPHQSACRP